MLFASFTRNCMPEIAWNNAKRLTTLTEISFSEKNRKSK